MLVRQRVPSDRVPAWSMASPQRRRSIVVALVAALVAAMAGPASGETIATRGFEEDLWDEPASNHKAVGEELGLIDLRSVDLSRTLRSNGFAGRGLRVNIPTGVFRGFGPLDRLGPWDDPSQAPDEVWFRYHIRLINWNAASTGKLPGLAGLYGSSGRGCIRSTETNRGWSARQMFGAPGTNGAPTGRIPIGTYLYHVDQPQDCGEGLWWAAGLTPGRWQCIEGQVKMNTPGQNDGVLRGWLDGKLEIAKTDIQYRRAGETGIGVRHMWHNVYFGGSWPTPNPLSLQYDEVVVSTSGRVGCMQPFTDIGQTMHANSIVDLHARGHLFGCEYRKACPAEELTRGQAAALIARILSLPTATRDYFTDDNGNTFEKDINRIAEAGITKGCNPPANSQYCPDRTMTRAEFVTMLGRALGLSGSASNAFNDIAGHTLADDINRFAAAGLTSGCGSGRFCPNRTLPRDESAAFFHRSLSVLQPLSLATVEPPPDWPPPGDPPPIPPEEED